jgi:hypothetical protein
MLATLRGEAPAVGQNDVESTAGSKVLASERLWAQGAHLRDVKALASIFG